MSKRRLRPLGDTQRRRILKRDNYTCVYCFELATEVDHIIPYSYIPDNTDANLVASCRLCNSIAGSMVFDSFNMKYQYIKREREKRPRPQNIKWHARAVRAFMDAHTRELPGAGGTAPKPAERVKPKKPKYIRPAKVEVVKPPRVVKPILIVEKIIKPKRHYYPPAPSAPPPPSLDQHEFVAGMYEYYARRNTPAYIQEIFERWLALETTKNWAAKNGRILPNDLVIVITP